MLWGRRGRRGGDGFNPTQIAGAQVWLRSDRGITVTGSGVSTWANQVLTVSGDATQGTDARRPAYATGGLNGTPKLTFDGTKALQWALDFQGVQSIFVVLRAIAVPGAGVSYHFLAIKGSTGPVAADFGLINSAGWQSISFRSDIAIGGANVAYYGTNPALDTNGHLYGYTFGPGVNPADVTNYSYVYDSATAQPTGSGSYNAAAVGVSSLGSLIDGGNNLVAPSNVEIYEVVVYNRALSAAEKLQLWTYAQNRYAL